MNKSSFWNPILETIPKEKQVATRKQKIKKTSGSALNPVPQGVYMTKDIGPLGYGYVLGIS